MAWFDFNPIAAALFGGGGNSTNNPKPYVQPQPVPVHLTLPQANPDWNTATVKVPAASQHGWSSNSLQSYLQTFQRLGGPATGNKIATNEQLFQPATNPGSVSFNEASKNPEQFMKDQAGAPGTQNVIPSLVANSVGGDMSPAAASLYGRMLGATPPPIVAATAPATTVKPEIPPYQGGGNPRQFTNRNSSNNAYNSAFQAGRNSLYRGMSPLQRQQANAVYNVTQPTSPGLK